VDRELADRSFGRLCDLLPQSPPGRPDPQLMLLVGDQIYADATAGLFDASADFDKFDGHYREAWTAPNAREALRRLPTYMMLDDHEIENDVEPEPGTERSALVAFESYQRRLAPPNRQHAPPRHAYWYTFRTKVADFFVADTRTGRRRRQQADCLQDTIMAAPQMIALRKWLQRDRRRVKFVACPSVVLPLSRGTGHSSAYALRSDWWDGFPFSLARLLTFIAENRIENVVFLGGDFHCSLATEIVLILNGNRTRLWSIVSSGLYAPYPFANTKAEDLELSYSGTLGDWYGVNGVSYYRDLRLTYEARPLVMENSYALVSLAPSSRTPGTELVVEFDTTAGIRREEFELA
jgi:phosphodiesterase/alkaline phosphatase D-like protein